MNARARALAAPLLIGAALLAALWFLAIAPKRSESAELSGALATQQSLLHAARAQVTSHSAARRRFPGLLGELRRLDRAVPARGSVSTMLRELQRRANVRSSDLRIIALKDPAQATATGAPATTPGAVAGPGGLSGLAFTFEYTGKYFDLLDILKTVRRSVRVTSGELDIGGRLLTIDGLSFKPVEGNPRLTKAVMNATAYIAPDGAAAANAPAAGPAGSPTPPAPGAGGSPAPAGPDPKGGP